MVPVGGDSAGAWGMSSARAAGEVAASTGGPSPVPGSVDTDLHHAAMRIELGPQATSIRSPEFQQRLAAAQRR